MALVRGLDFFVLALALPVFVAGGLPLAAYGIAAFAFTVQRGAQVWVERRVRGSEDPKTVIGLTVGGAMARAWFCFACVLVGGLTLGDTVGLAAVGTLIVVLVVSFLARLVERGADELEEASR